MSLKVRQYIYEAISTAGIMGLGDVMAQTVVEKKPIKEIDLVRCTKFGSLGFFVVGPVLRFWYTLLDRRIGGPQNIKRTVKKVIVDQAIMAPPLNLAIAGLVALINNEKPQQIKRRIVEQYPEIMLANYATWPAVQFVNFGFVPLRYQVAFEQLVAVFWNCFISQLLNDEVKSPKVIEK